MPPEPPKSQLSVYSNIYICNVYRIQINTFAHAQSTAYKSYCAGFFFGSCAWPAPRGTTRRGNGRRTEMVERKRQIEIVNTNADTHAHKEKNKLKHEKQQAANRVNYHTRNGACWKWFTLLWMLRFCTFPVMAESSHTVELI